MQDNYYIYYYDRETKKYVYERTTSTEESAKARIKELEKQGIKHCVYLINNIISGAFY